MRRSYLRSIFGGYLVGYTPIIIFSMFQDLKRLFLVFLAGGICLGGSGLMADQVALQAIREAGGIVRPMGGGWEIEFQRKGKAMSSDSLEKVALLGDSVVALNLRGTLTTDEGLRQLEGLSNLGRLHLERTEVGDEGMAHLAGLKKLTYLNVYGTTVTDKGLAHLASLEDLQRLYVWETGVTDAGCDLLARSLPRLKIVRGVNLDEVAAAAEARKKESEEKQEKVVRVNLDWTPAGTETPPRSTGGGILSSISIINSREEAVKLYWVEYGGGLKYYAEIAAGDTLTRGSFSKATWLITDLNEEPLGYFTAIVEPSQVEVPK